MSDEALLKARIKVLEDQVEELNIDLLELRDALKDANFERDLRRFD